MALTLKAENRDLLKKKVKALRKDGMIPAGIFGFKGNTNVQLNTKDFGKLFAEAGHTSLVEIELDGKIHNVIIDEVQIDPVSREAQHVSLREVRMDEEITAEIPFELVGEENSPAVKDQESLVILSTPTIEVKGLPKNIPSEIKIDVSKFSAGDTVILKDVKLPANIQLIHDDEEYLEMTIVTTASAIQEEVVHAPSVAEIEAATAAETAEGSEPVAEEAA